MLRSGATVALLTPASPVEPDWVEQTVRVIDSWGWRARVGRHALNTGHGFLAGTDLQRRAEVEAALLDDVAAIICLRGGCGSLRLDDLTSLVAANPKPIVGFSDITALHLVWQAAGVPSVHGAVAGQFAADVRDILTGAPVRVSAAARRFGASLTTRGTASGRLVGGNLEMLARSVGVTPMDFRGAIVLIEINRAAGLGMVDRAMTQLVRSGMLHGIAGVAVGALDGFEGYVDRGWTVLDVLGDWLGRLEVPVLAGLPLGHLTDLRSVPLGVPATLDADAGTLEVASICG